MNRKSLAALSALVVLILAAPVARAEEPQAYKIGIDDVLDIAVLQPDPLQTQLTVSPDGAITFPYIGNVVVKGKSLVDVQTEVQSRLGAFMKGPVVSVSLRESRSRSYFVYGEVNVPGSYPLRENITVIRAISVAGGLTKYGSKSKIKILRQKPDGSGNDVLSVNLKGAMAGDPKHDLRLEPGDVVTVEEGLF